MITNVVIMDHWGIVRADVGIRAGRIVGIGRSGNPDIADGVDPNLIIGPGTDAISGEGKILTAGGFDSHVHFLSPSQIHEALAAGLTTLGGGGTGPSEGSKATTVTPGAWHLKQAHRAMDEFPVNLLLLGKGNTVSAAAFEEQALAGAGGYKVHEDWGSTPAAMDAALKGAEEWGLQVALHSDSLNEAGFVDSTIAAMADRSISAFHVEGAGGGHAPDILTIAGLPYVLPGSTNPTLPHTVNTVAEHLDMLMVCHHLNPAVPEDLAFAESRIRATTIAAEDHLHDLGAISMTSSDAQAMGRIGEVITRTWQVAHLMKQVRGELGGGLPADNFRARRYVAKYTINPAIAHGVDHEIGSIEVGKLADLVLWDPRFFGVRPTVVIKGGGIVVGALGDPNASIPTPQPVLMRPTLYYGSGSYRSQSYVAPAALAAGLADDLGLRRELVAVRPTRAVGKAQMINNDALPEIEIDSETHRITVDGTEITRPRPRCCHWPSCTSSSEVSRPYLTMLLADGRLPTGAHTQSAGVEPAFAYGMRLDQVPDYLRVRLRTVTEVEAAAAVVARHRWLTEPAARTPAMLEVDAAWRVRTLSDALREASDLLGRSYLRTAGAVWSLGALREAGGVWCRAVVLGATAAEAGLSSAELVRLVGFEDVQTVIAAALKLEPFDPSLAVAWAAATEGEVEELVRRVGALTTTAEIPAYGAPLIEEWGQRHRDAERRLFRA